MKHLLSHPLTRDLPLDDPRIVPLRAKIVKSKGFLKSIYLQWYRLMVDHLPKNSLPVIELGTGPGFLRECLPGLITSDLAAGGNVDVVLNAQDLPFPAASLGAVVMVDVLHHIQNPRSFFLSASRCIRAGGYILMIEPWNTPWSRWVYTHLHHENFDPGAEAWELNAARLLSSANGALPWILFSRDRAQFLRDFPTWEVDFIHPIMPLAYLVSGGFTTQLSPPSWTYPLIHAVEILLSPLNPHLAMFAFIGLRRAGES